MVPEAVRRELRLTGRVRRTCEREKGKGGHKISLNEQELTSIQGLKTYVRVRLVWSNCSGEEVIVARRMKRYCPVEYRFSKNSVRIDFCHAGGRSPFWTALRQSWTDSKELCRKLDSEVLKLCSEMHSESAMRTKSMQHCCSIVWGSKRPSGSSTVDVVLTCSVITK